MGHYKDFIPENVALPMVRRIGIFNEKGNRVGFIPLGNLAIPDTGRKQYSFGALSDVHLGYDTAQADFQKALTYLNETEDVAFTCVCGDLTSGGHDYQLAEYKNYTDIYSPNTPVYSITGNHDCYVIEDVASVISQYTGKPLNFTVEHGNDVFIMFGESGYTAGNLFTAESLQWLYEILETNRNRRCFVFFHVFPWGDSGNANNLYKSNLFQGTLCNVFQSLMVHYKNVVLFHGHSHLKFCLQSEDDKANYSNALGFKSVHIPSLSVPRMDVDGDGKASGENDGRDTIWTDSEGYVVDVYPDGIHLRGRDFIKGEFLPIASYWLDTTLKTVEARTYTDSTGTINTTP